MLRSTVLPAVRSALESLGGSDSDDEDTSTEQADDPEADEPDHPELKAAADRLRYSPDRTEGDRKTVVDALDHPDAAARELAVAALAGLPESECEQAADALPAVVEHLDDDQRGIQRNAATAVGRLGEADPEAARNCAPELAAALTAHSARVCEGAGRALQAGATVAPAEVAELVAEYVDPGTRVITRERAVATLGAAAEADPEAIEPVLEDLIELLERGTNDRPRVVTALAAVADRYPGRIAPAGAALVTAAREGDDEEREAAIRALTVVVTAGDEVFAVDETVALLTASLAESEPEHSEAAADALVAVFDRHPDSRETAREVLERTDGNGRLRAAKRLVATGDDDAEALARESLADSPLLEYLDRPSD